MSIEIQPYSAEELSRVRKAISEDWNYEERRLFATIDAAERRAAVAERALRFAAGELSCHEPHTHKHPQVVFEELKQAAINANEEDGDGTRIE